MDDRDKRLLTYLEKRIRNYGFTPYFAEREISVPQQLNTSIQDLIRKSDIVLVFLSKDTINSWFVIQEIRYAQQQKKPIVIIKERGVVLPDGLQNVHSIEFDYQKSEEFTSSFNTWLQSAYLNKVSQTLNQMKDDNQKMVLGLVAIGLLVSLVFLASKK